MAERPMMPIPPSAVPNVTTDAARNAALMVWVSLGIFALAKSVVALLTQIGAANPIDGRNPISFCNVLLVGNLIAAATLYALHHKDWTRENFARLTARDWIGILIMGVLAGALAPALAFLALENTTVSNVVFLGRIEPLVFMILAAVVLSDRPDRWSIVGSAISFVGVALILYLSGLESGGFMLGRGEVYALLAAVALAAGTLLSKIFLKSVPFGIFAVLRMLIGAVIYFFWAYYFFGPVHFADVFEPVLWQWMLVYGAIIVAGGQTLFLLGVRNARGQDVALAQSFSPIAAVIFAYLLLGEVPGWPIVIGGSVILLGIFIAQAGAWYARKLKEQRESIKRLTHSEVMEVEGREGFKGV
ncbi:MAG: DMT family transporter [Hyphomicrobiaceae bacterium]|nr:DMT family transporter [Hyphomicrobiaceae bacterium]